MPMILHDQQASTPPLTHHSGKNKGKGLTCYGLALRGRTFVLPRIFLGFAHVKDSAIGGRTTVPGFPVVAAGCGRRVRGRGW
jgi:hypothetical protein